MQQPKIFVASPIFKTTTRHTVTSLVELAVALTARGWWGSLGCLSRPDIATLRDAFVTVWYDQMQDRTHILQIDDDMDFDPQLIFDMVEFDKPIVGAIYPKKTSPLQFVGDPLDSPPEPVNGHQLQRWVGAGVLLIRRDAIDTMLAKMPEIIDTRIAKQSIKDLLQYFNCNRIFRLFDEVETEDGPLGEDYSFCHRARQCGLEIWANVAHRIIHVGEYGYQGCYADVIRAGGQNAPAA